ncbi:MAG: hypothetical protein NTZ05_00430 [Chloroflexi bacterium]|nr:hypothetical protein [Chloroflexota bacterium]
MSTTQDRIQATQEAIADFERALAAFDQSPPNHDAVMQQIMRAALEMQLQDLREQFTVLENDRLRGIHPDSIAS